MNYDQLKQYLGNNLWYGENNREDNFAELMSGLSNKQKSAILVMPDGSRVWGIDLSHWNLPPVDLKRMVDDYGLSFVFIKGCDGSLNTKHYLEHVEAAKYAGIPWGMYVWLYRNANVSISAQTTTWTNRAQADPPPLGVSIDAEWTNYGGVPQNPNATDLRSAHDSLRTKYGKPAITYTAPGYANQYLIGFDFTKEENWIASWGVDKPNWPAGWTWHQFTNQLDGKQLDPNGNLSIDGNYFYGTRVEFIARFGGGGTTPPPPTGDNMKYQGTVIAVGGLNVRNAPSGIKIFAMPYLTKIEADKVENKWWHLTSIGGVAVSVENWSFEGEAQGYIRTDAIITPEPPSLPDYFIGYDAGGNALGKYNKE